MSKIKERNFHSMTAFLDLLFNSLLAFVAFFVITLYFVNPKVDVKKNVEIKAEAIITMTWPLEANDDVDLYVEDPVGKIVYFRKKDSGLMHLDRDDTGHNNDVVKIDGREFRYKENKEIVVIRGLLPGEYVVNIHMYAKRTPVDKTSEVTVTLEKLNPSLQLLASKNINLDYMGEEVTAFRFSVDENGSIYNVNELSKKFVGNHP